MTTITVKLDGADIPGFCIVLSLHGGRILFDQTKIGHDNRQTKSGQYLEIIVEVPDDAVRSLEMFRQVM